MTLTTATATGIIFESIGMNTLPMATAAVFACDCRIRIWLAGDAMVLARSPCAHETCSMIAM